MAEYEDQSPELQDELDGEPVYTAFWPLVILMGGFIISLGYQIVELNNHRMGLDSEFEKATPQIREAQAAYVKFNALGADLYQTGQKDQYAAAIFREANLRMAEPPATNGAAATPPPAAH